jgi:hypothetical protein
MKPIKQYFLSSLLLAVLLLQSGCATTKAGASFLVFMEAVVEVVNPF